MTTKYIDEAERRKTSYRLEKFKHLKHYPMYEKIKERAKNRFQR